ncbi:MAG: hypothetical protein ACI4U9_03770 [Clostridia bacterium]
MDVSILLTVRQELGNPKVELEGECEGQNIGNESVLALTRFISDTITLAKEFGGELIPTSKELPMNKFFLAINFASDENKRLFLGKLPTVQ